MSLALIWGIANTYRSIITEDMITNLKEIDRQKMQKIAKFYIFEKLYFHVFNNISGHIWPKKAYYTSN